MTLSWPVVAAVLFGALLHASWNALVKSSSDKDLDMAVIHLIGSFLGIPLVALAGWPVAAAWPYIAASVVVHIGYYLALTGAYRHGELGLTYPLMRGVAPLLVALSATFTLGETLSPLAWAGVLGISCGVLVLGLNAHALKVPKAVGFALANAVIIAIYTVIDGLGVRASGNALQYVATLFLLDGWPFALLMFATRGRAVGIYARHRWPVATLGACASLGSYGIALWAMTRAPVATVAALRETSVLFAVLLGAWFLKEAFTPRRALGTCVIVAGVMALRLG
ncbi:MAG: DMT family transporter [Burkholderiales bacterium]|jgi:phosphonate utilization associated putative membrane protein|nr:DMT family transporter [Burkholderiales bacterium]